MSGVAFRVHGVPAPQGSKRAFVVGTRAVVTDVNPAPLKTWREDVKYAAVDAMNGHAPFEGPLELLVTFVLVKPKSVKRAWPFVRPDLDKLVRAVGDALTSAGVYTDDAQLVQITARKVYGVTTGAEIIVRMMSDDDVAVAA